MNTHSFYSNTTGIKFLDKIIAYLDACAEFAFTVSFIKKAGLVLLYDHIESALQRGARGKILTSTYQNFTDIASLEMFYSLQERFPKRFECHLEYNSFGNDGFHTKGYLFTFKDYEEVIIGSSNFTRFALLLNKEWDVGVTTDPNDGFLTSVRKEFDYFWNNTNKLDRDIIRRYSIRLAYAIEQWDMDYIDPDKDGQLKPNMMQRKALKEIRRYRDLGADKALVVAATGSGKTYLAAFDALNFDPKKLLFIVHKETILVDAIKTFRNVFGSKKTYGLYTGNDQSGLQSDFCFSTNAMMKNHLDLFDPKEFQYIVIDEVHHASASTYKAIMGYFKPEFLLGLTATPDRMDGEDVYSLFGNNVPYDLRLREAMENDLIVPFKYFGVKDSLVSYADDSPSGIRKIISELASKQHCEFVKSEIEKHRTPFGKLKCVGFCRTIEHARMTSEQMNELGLPSAYLTGSNTTGERIALFHRLEDEKDDLNVIFAVDILNEGVDIPAMNMVLFLRPTESSTIFIQQLGRGLRKYQNKGYLTVLDFIANSYKRSVEIALALGTMNKSGTVDKQTLLDYVRTDFKSIDISGLEIHLDPESKDEILNSISSTNFNNIRLLIQDFKNFEEFLRSEKVIQAGEYPMPTDFLYADGNTDFLRYAKKEGNYFKFLEKAEPKNCPFFSFEQSRVLTTLTWYLPLVRNEEFKIIASLIEGPKKYLDLCGESLLDGTSTKAALDHALTILRGDVAVNATDEFMPLIKKEGDIYSLNFEFVGETFRDWVADTIEYGLTRYESDYGDRNGLLKLYGKYSAPTSFQAMNIYAGETTDKANLMPMSGVQYTDKGLCIYVTLNKNLQKEERLKYKDKFLSNKVMQWESQTNTTLTNGKGLKLIATKRAKVFVRKTKTEDGADMPYVYLGEGTMVNPRTSDNSGVAILFDVILDNAVPEVYEYDFGIKDAD